ncbi:hypothetical protein [Antribacter gilvus]|uniref:hypothetical protein n=1 Tax=Antribacter gilvus TaxID=2304675 RepID=UPI000F769B1F|nr:hypothetical protein [Antribacter gilvus]
MRKIPRCVIHIGAEKTGTTAVQASLRRCRDVLAASGVLYSRSLTYRDSVSHQLAATTSMDPGRVDDLRQNLGLLTAQSVERHRREVAAELREEVGGAVGATTFLISSEHLHSRLVTPAEVVRLRELLDGLFDEIEVLVYLRPQHEVALSLYSTRLKVGLPHVAPLSEEAAEPGYFDYGGLVTRWADAFGADKLTVRTFEKDRLRDGDILADFRTAAALPLALPRVPTGANTSLSRQGLSLLRAVNRLAPRYVAGRPNPVRGPLVRLVERAFPGGGPVATRSEAFAFFERFDASNEIVRKMYFTDRASLFTPSFSEYPAGAEGM